MVLAVDGGGVKPGHTIPVSGWSALLSRAQDPVEISREVGGELADNDDDDILSNFNDYTDCPLIL